MIYQPNDPQGKNSPNNIANLLGAKKFKDANNQVPRMNDPFAATGPQLNPRDNFDLFSKQGRADQASAMGFNPNRANEIPGWLHSLGISMLPGVEDDIRFGQSLMPGRREAITAMIGNMGPAATQARVDRNTNREMSMAGQGGALAALLNRSQGMGDGFQAGQNAGIAQEAAMRSAQFERDENSPDAQLKRLMALLGATDQGTQSAALGQLMQVLGPVFQQQQIRNAEPKSQTLFSQIAGAVAPFAGSIKF